MILTVYSPPRPILQSNALGLPTWINGVSEVSVYASRRKGEYEYSRNFTMRETFTRSPNQYKEYLSEFWYSAKALKNSKVFFSTPTAGGKTGDFDQITNKDAIMLYSLANEINIDCASIFGEDIIFKLNKKHKERVILYSRFLSLLMMHKMKGYGDGDVTLNPTQVFNVNNLGTEAKPT
ncbi:hypothetical protein Tco_0603810 [Tanacetum coccineum]